MKLWISTKPVKKSKEPKKNLNMKSNLWKSPSILNTRLDYWRGGGVYYFKIGIPFQYSRFYSFEKLYSLQCTHMKLYSLQYVSRKNAKCSQIKECEKFREKKYAKMSQKTEKISRKNLRKTASEKHLWKFREKIRNKNAKFFENSLIRRHNTVVVRAGHVPTFLIVPFRSLSQRTLSSPRSVLSIEWLLKLGYLKKSGCAW